MTIDTQLFRTAPEALRATGARIVHAARGDGLWRRWRLLERTQWLSREELEERRRGRLAVLLAHACRNVPFYADIARSRDVSPPLSAFPLLDKAAIRKAGAALHWDALGKKDIRQSSTSGSTGESLFFRYDRSNGFWRMASTFRHARWCGVTPFSAHAFLWGARFDAPAASLKQRLRVWIHPELFLSSYDLDVSTMDRYLSLLRQFQPRAMTSYPSPMARFAEHCRRRGERLPSLRAIICSAEQLFDHQRESIQAAFGVPVFNRYGSREFSTVAHECSMHEGLHVDSDRMVVEILDASGSPCPPGVVGEIVVTDLTNYAMPFIRYRTGDLACWSPRACPCGRGLPLLARIEGRVFDLVRTPSGKCISGTFWTLLIRHVAPQATAFQVRQNQADAIRILLQLSDGASLAPSAEKALLERIAQAAPDLQVALERVERIPLTRGGKHRFVVSEVGAHEEAGQGEGHA